MPKGAWRFPRPTPQSAASLAHARPLRAPPGSMRGAWGLLHEHGPPDSDG